MVNLLEKYKSSLFERNYLSEKEVKSTFNQIIKYLELGIMVGFVEKSIANDFNKLHPFVRTSLKIFKGIGKKYIDRLCREKGYDWKIDSIHNNELPFINLHILKYEVLEIKK